MNLFICANLPGSGKLQLGKAHTDCPLPESWRGVLGTLWGKDSREDIGSVGKIVGSRN